jgi:hypothetical protein
MIQILVEGKLDVEVLQPLLPISLATVIAVGPKQALPARCRAERAREQAVYYLRDRDFDVEPSGEPGPIAGAGGLGWHWQRHEIENYLLDPAVVANLPGINPDPYGAALLEAGRPTAAGVAAIRRPYPDAVALATASSFDRCRYPATSRTGCEACHFTKRST